MRRHLPLVLPQRPVLQWSSVRRQFSSLQRPPQHPRRPGSAFTHRHRNPSLQPVSLRRQASTAATDARSAATRLKNAIYGTVLILFTSATVYYVTDTRASIHRYVVPPLLRTLFPDAETAHEVGTEVLAALYTFGLHPRERGNPDGSGDLAVEVFGETLQNPIGISAGLDKGAEIPDPLFDTGVAIVEVGGITPLPQQGNPKPRVFRIPSQEALINRYGLNSEGAEFVAMILRQRVRDYAYKMGYGVHEEAERIVLDGEAGVPPGSLQSGKLLCVQVAKMATTPTWDVKKVTDDYVFCVDQIGRYADVVVVNVSSPNTPGLRALQQVEPLTEILRGVVGAAQRVKRKQKPKVMVKVSPDEETQEEIDGVCEAVWKSGVDGVIVGNTTRRRPEPLPQGYTLSPKESKVLVEQGGYSGPQMFERTLELVKKYRRTLDVFPQQENGSLSAVAPSSDVGPLKSLAQGETGDHPESSILHKVQDAASKQSSGSSPSIGSAISAIPSAQASQASPSDSDPFPPAPSSSDPTSTSTSIPLTSPVPTFSPPVPASDPTDSLKPHNQTSGAVPRTATPEGVSEGKVIFATGGITNGQQALEILNAGASVAMMYTTVVYNGVGTVTRVKKEMRKTISEASQEK